MKPDFLITNAVVLPRAGSHDTIDCGFVATKNGVIKDIGPMSDIPYDTAVERIDAKGCLVMPGLVNTHCHAAMTLFRGMADDMDLPVWLNEHIFPAEAEHVKSEMVYWCSKLAAAEMLLSGTTLVADGYFYEGDAARAFADAGIRSVAAHGVIDFPAPGVPDPTENISAAARFIDEWQSQNSLVTPAVFAHSPYTCSSKTLVKAKELAVDRNVPFFIHVAETSAEQAMISDPQGPTPVKHLDALGVLDEQTICVHCVWVDEEDMDILAERGTKISICPQSHLKLASGIAPLPDMLGKGITVGLGTDGAASNNGLDLFREMDVCAKIQKLRTLDPVTVKAGKVMQMATTDGAEVIGLGSKTGTLEKGYLADLVVVDLKQPHLQPFYNPEVIVYAAGGGDVRDVIVGGRMVVRNRQLLAFDLEEILSNVRSLAQKLT